MEEPQIWGSSLIALRTGAASAIARRILSHPDSRTLGLVGCGAQVVTQFYALSRVFKLREALVYDIEPNRAQSFAQRAAFISMLIRIRESLLCPDHRQRALFEGECQQVSADEIGPDLAELVQHPESYVIQI